MEPQAFGIPDGMAMIGRPTYPRYDLLLTLDPPPPPTLGEGSCLVFNPSNQRIAGSGDSQPRIDDNS